LEGFTLYETPVVGYLNLLDQVGVVEEIDVTVKSAVVENIPVLTSPLRIQFERAYAPQREVADYAAIPATGRENQRLHKVVVNISFVDVER
jgi:hypothetical protein